MWTNVVKENRSLAWFLRVIAVFVVLMQAEFVDPALNIVAMAFEDFGGGALIAFGHFECAGQNAVFEAFYDVVDSPAFVYFLVDQLLDALLFHCAFFRHAPPIDVQVSDIPLRLQCRNHTTCRFLCRDPQWPDTT